MEEIKLNDVADSLIIFNKITFDRLLKTETPADNIALYTFYYYTAKWQKTNQPKCTIAYVANGLKWSESRVRKAKKELSDIGLVEDITSKDESGKISGHFVKVNYFSSSTLKDNHTVENPQCGTADTVEMLETNALYNNINALDNYNKCLKKDKEVRKERKSDTPKQKKTFDEIFQSYTQDPETLYLLGEWLKVRKAKRAALTDSAIQLNLEKLNRLARESNLSVNDYLKEVICRGWQAFYPIKEYKAKSAPKEESTGNVFLDIMKDEGLL